MSWWRWLSLSDQQQQCPWAVLTVSAAAGVVGTPGVWVWTPGFTHRVCTCCTSGCTVPLLCLPHWEGFSPPRRPALLGDAGTRFFGGSSHSSSLLNSCWPLLRAPQHGVMPRQLGQLWNWLPALRPHRSPRTPLNPPPPLPPQQPSQRFTWTRKGHL